LNLTNKSQSTIPALTDIFPCGWCYHRATPLLHHTAPFVILNLPAASRRSEISTLYEELNFPKKKIDFFRQLADLNDSEWGISVLSEATFPCGRHPCRFHLFRF